MVQCDAIHELDYALLGSESPNVDIEALTSRQSQKRRVRDLVVSRREEKNVKSQGPQHVKSCSFLQTGHSGDLSSI